MFKRVGTGTAYYTVRIEQGKAEIFRIPDEHDSYDDKRFENNNYFLTEERAKEVAEKINALLKLERIYDMLRPEYKPDLNNTEPKCNISTNCRTGKIGYQLWGNTKMPTVTYFPKDKINEAIELYKSMK